MLFQTIDGFGKRVTAREVAGTLILAKDDPGALPGLVLPIESWEPWLTQLANAMYQRRVQRSNPAFSHRFVLDGVTTFLSPEGMLCEHETEGQLLIVDVSVCEALLALAPPAVVELGFDRRETLAESMGRERAVAA